MRIAVNTRLLVPGKMDGIGRFTLESLKRISKAHPEVSFDFIFDRDPDPEFKLNSNVNLHKVGLPARHPVLWYLWFEHSLKDFVNKGNYDLFLSPEGWIPPKLNCPSLGVIHDLNFVHLPENIIFSHRTYLNHYFPKFARRANRLATVSNFSKKDIERVYNIASQNIDVVYNGVNEDFNAIDSIQQEEIRAKFSGGNPYFIFVGTLHPRKNLEHLFLAFDEFKSKSDSKVKLLVVGNKKWWPKKLSQIFEKLSHADEIIFTGRQDDATLSKLLSSAIALTYLPYFEGFGIPILEAFQCKTAVITSNTSSMPEVAADAALLCTPTSVEEISKAMLKISQETDFREDLINKGTTRVKDFSWDRTAKLLWSSIEKTLEHGT